MLYGEVIMQRRPNQLERFCGVWDNQVSSFTAFGIDHIFCMLAPGYAFSRACFRVLIAHGC